MPSQPLQSPEYWNTPIGYPLNADGELLGSAPGFRSVLVIDHPTSKLVEPDVPTRSVYAGFDLYTGEDKGEKSEYLLPGSLKDVWVREEVAYVLEACHNAFRKVVPKCEGICILDGFRTDKMQRAAVTALVRKYLGESYAMQNTDTHIDQGILFDCARRAQSLWVQLGIEENDLLLSTTAEIRKDEKLMAELKNIAAKDQGITVEQLTDAQVSEIIGEYIRIVYNTGMNADRHPGIANLSPLINNGPHMTGGATDAKLIGLDGKLLATHTPFDYSYHGLSSELTLESEEGIAKLRVIAKEEKELWLRRHYEAQGMNPDEITDADIGLMRMHQRFQTNVIIVAGGAPYILEENWHVDWPENPKDPMTGRLIRPPSIFSQTLGWNSGNPSSVTENYAKGKYATKENPHGVKAVFGGKQAFQEARKLKIIE